MDDFAGGMAEAHAKSWTGMVENAKNYIGQIGEAFLDGTFQDAKEQLADFISYLETDEAMEKAEEMGEKFREVMNKIGRAIKSVVKWYMNLSDGQKDLVNKAAISVVALGPLLTIFGKLGLGISNTAKGLGVFFKWLAPILTPVKNLVKPLGSVASNALKGGRAFTVLKQGLKVLGGPVGWVIGIITTLVGILTTAYKKSETFRNAVGRLIDSFKSFGQAIMDWFKPAVDAVKNFIGEMSSKVTGFSENEGPGLSQAWQNIWDVIGAVLGWITDAVTWTFEKVVQPVIQASMWAIEKTVIPLWEGLKLIISGALDVILSAVRVWSSLFRGDWSGMWDAVKDYFSGIIDIIKGIFKISFIGQLVNIAKGFIKNFPEYFSKAWGLVKKVFWDAPLAIHKTLWSWLLELPKTVAKGTANLATSFTKWLIDAVPKTIKKLGEWLTSFLGWVKELPSRIWEGTKNLSSTFTDWISKSNDKTEEKLGDWWGTFKDWIVELPGKIWDATKKLASFYTDWITDTVPKTLKKLGEWWVIAKD